MILSISFYHLNTFINFHYSATSDSHYSSDGLNPSNKQPGNRQPTITNSNHCQPTETSLPTKPQRSSRRVNNRYMTSVKTFLGVTLLYMLAFAPSGIRFMFFSYNFEHLTEYCFFFNHIGNPFIYVAFNKAFRNEVMRCFSRCKCIVLS